MSTRRVVVFLERSPKRRSRRRETCHPVDVRLVILGMANQ